MILTIDKFDGPWRFLSNFSPHGFVISTLWFLTVEHWYQANKVCVGNTDDFRKIMNAETPGKAKRLGQKVKLRPDWEDIKIEVMLKGVMEKFKQNHEILELLKKTGDKILVEGNHWHDNIWGDCSCPKCEKKIGKNLLGNVLMHVRDQLT